MSQSEWIAAALVAGFLLFLALKGKLGAYWSLLIGGGAPPGSPGAQVGATGAMGMGPASPAPSLGGILGGGILGGGGGLGGIAGSNLPGGSSSSGTVSGTVTSSGQTTTQGWSLLPGVLPPLQTVFF